MKHSAFLSGRLLLLWLALLGCLTLPTTAYGVMCAPRHHPSVSQAHPTPQVERAQPLAHITQRTAKLSNLFSNLSLGLGIGSLLLFAGTIMLAIACFGGCSPLIFGFMLLGTVIFGLAAMVLGIWALLTNKDPQRSGVKIKAIFGLVTGLLGAGFVGLLFAI